MTVNLQRCWTCYVLATRAAGGKNENKRLLRFVTTKLRTGEDFARNAFYLAAATVTITSCLSKPRMDLSQIKSGPAAFAHAVMAVLLLCAAAGSASAANYDEAGSGDISNDRLAPTVIVLGPGSNLVQGSFGLSPVPNVADLDYFTVTVPNGYRLDAVVLAGLIAGGANSFLGVQVGPQMTMPSTSHDPSPLLGWAHVYSNQIGTDVLPAMTIVGPLAAGSYTFWSNETDTSAAWSYAYNFQVSALPEPASDVPLPTWALVALAAGLFVGGLLAIDKCARRA